MKTRGAHSRALLALCSIALFGSLSSFVCQNLSSNDRSAGHIMLKNIKEAIKKNYYDPSFHGIDLDQTFKAADEKINVAASNGQVFGIIAQFVRSFDDTHTFFLPPSHSLRVSYDWQIQMVGDHCYIMAVKPGSDAEAKGLRAGDILHVIDGYKVTREDFWLLSYLYNQLQPHTQLNLVVQSPGEQPRRVDYTASSRQGKKALDLTQAGGVDYYDLVRENQENDHIYEHRFKGYGNDLYIWKMPQFDLPILQVNELMAKANNYKTLVIDLRGNPGGYVDTLLQVIGNLFDHDVKLGDRKRRKDNKPLIAKTRGHDIFQGQLILLVDNGSASCSEMLSRVIQLEKRGTVIGDVTAGAVMESIQHRLSLGENSLLLYGVSITDADIIMNDGASLEHVGVKPNKLMLPTGSELRDQSDPVMAYAASLAGVKLDPKAAGALFPIRWKLQP
jgi:C-terminal processing protease CtpA/Prc